MMQLDERLKRTRSTTEDSHATQLVCRICHGTDVDDTKSRLASVAGWFRRLWPRNPCRVGGIHSTHTCETCTARVFPEHMLLLLRHDDQWLQNSEDNWEGRISAIIKPILRAETRIKKVEQGLLDVETKLSHKISSIEQSQQCILKLVQNLNSVTPSQSVPPAVAQPRGGAGTPAPT